MDLKTLCLRLLLAMLTGAMIGGERESLHRPAGLRTHMLVSIGSAVVMLLGIEMTVTYPGADPARLGAQVISGIGFLGAGTILREGVAIKGLTTAASLWAVACIGLAAGAGFYAAALIGTVVILVTLTVFERLPARLLRARDVSYTMQIDCTDTAPVLQVLGECAAAHHLLLCDLHLSKQETTGYVISCRLKSDLPRKAPAPQELLAQLSGVQGVLRLSVDSL